MDKLKMFAHFLISLTITTKSDINVSTDSMYILGSFLDCKCQNKNWKDDIDY